MNFTLNANVTDIFAEIEVKTGYNGAKAVVAEGEADPFERISIIDEDHPELLQYFNECRAELALEFAHKLISEGYATGSTTDYKLVLNMHETFNTAIKDALDITLFNYFVYGIIYRWYMIVNKGEAAAYAEVAAGCLTDLRNRLMIRCFQRPTRPF